MKKQTNQQTKNNQPTKKLTNQFKNVLTNEKIN